MWYLNPEKTEEGYYCSQTVYIEGFLELPDELLETFLAYNGFVELTVEGETVTAITPDIEAYEAWLAAQPTDRTSKTVWDELDEAYQEGVDSI